jgi:hypothetical protein
MTIRLQDMIAELRRELRRRQISYPTLIKRGALTEAAANRQNARLQAILDVLVNLEEIDTAPEASERVTPEQRSSDAGICTPSILNMHSSD